MLFEERLIVKNLDFRMNIFKCIAFKLILVDDINLHVNNLEADIKHICNVNLQQDHYKISSAGLVRSLRDFCFHTCVIVSLLKPLERPPWI